VPSCLALCHSFRLRSLYGGGTANFEAYMRLAAICIGRNASTRNKHLKT
jgi:hypothetical protein